MKKLDHNLKQEIKGGVSQLVIFGIITLVASIIGLVGNLTSNALNAEANARAAAVEPKFQNYDYQKHHRTTVY